MLKLTAVIIAVLMAHSVVFSECAPLWYRVSSINLDFSLNAVSPGSRNQTNDTLQIECPESISTYTDINECTAYISSGLNLVVSSGTSVSVFWEMSGATEGASRRTGINQINSYVFNEGTTIITYTVRDRNGNTADCSFTVTISDNQVPRLVSVPKNISVEAVENECGAYVSWPEPEVVDNCTPSYQILKTSSHVSGAFFPIGTTQVTYIVDDGMATTKLTYSFTVTVADKSAPVLTAPEPISITCNDKIPNLYPTLRDFTDAGGTAADNCTLVPGSFKFAGQSQSSAICPYSLTRTYQLSDTYGNIGKVEQLIFVGEPTKEPAKKEVLTLKSAMAGTITAKANGPWNDINTWDLARIPAFDDDVIIPNGFTVNITAQAECNNLSIASGGSLIITGTNALSVYGNWTNNGSFTPNNSSVTFAGTGTANIFGATTFKNLTANKGTNCTNLINIDSPIIVTGNLTPDNGLFVINSGGTINCTFNTGFTIKSTAGIHVNGGNLTTGAFSITNDGLFQISNGSTVNLGDQSGNSLQTRGGATFQMNGGTLNVAGRLVNTAGTINIAGGTINLNTVGHNSSTIATFDLSLSTVFNMTGGTIIFSKPNGTAYLDIDIVNSTGSKIISGGTFVFGGTAITSGSIFKINSVAAFNDLTLYDGKSIKLVAGSDLTVKGTLALNDGIIDVNTSNKNVIITNQLVSALSRTTGFIQGKLQRNINQAGVNYLFPLGDGSTSSAIQLNFNSITAPGYVTASSSGTLPSGFLLNSTTVTGPVFISDNTVGFNTVSGSYQSPTGFNPSQKVGLFNSSWSYQPATASVNFSGWTNLPGSAFALADCIPPTITGILNVCVGSTTPLTGSGTPDATTPWVSVSTGVATIDNSGIVTGVSAGTSLITYTDIAGCQETANVTVNALPTLISSKVDVSCFGGNNGTMTAVGSNGISPYGYVIAGPTVNTTGAETGIFTGLAAGAYTVTVTDANGCTTTTAQTITQPAAALSATSTRTPVLCFGGTTGTMTAVGSNGTSPYGYVIAGPTVNTTGAVTGIFTGLAAGAYTITVTDANGCTTTTAQTITQPASALSATSTRTPVLCFGGTTGTMTAVGSNGTSSYSYVIAGPTVNTTGAVSGVFTGLTAGAYTVTVIDANGCTTTTSQTITQPAELTATGVELSAVSCNGLSDGSANVTPTGGTSPYTITPAQTGLSAGTKTFTVTDANGCITMVDVNISTIIDVTYPIISNCPASFSVNTTGVSCFEVVNFTAPTITDNCSLATVTWQLNGATNLSSPGAGINYLTGNRNIQVGITTLTYTATDAAGNSTICTYNITVIDNKLPVIACPSVNPLYNTDAGLCAANLSFAATATDNCGVQFIKYYIGLAEITFPYNFPKGTTTVKAVATDNSGNTAECSFNVNVIDAEKPLISCVPGSPFTRNADLGVCNYTVQGTEFDPVSFTDNCTGTTISNNFNNQPSLAGAVLPSGNTNIIWTATDASGNKSTCSINIQIADAQMPVVSNCPGDINIDTDPVQLTCSKAVTWTPPTFTDFCSGIIIPVASHTPGQLFPVGTTTVTYSATDASGNTASCSFTVTVDDKTLPTFTAPGPKTVYAKSNCTYDITVGITGDVTNEFDNCTNPGLQATWTDLPPVYGSCAGTYTITRVWTLTDNNGNTAASQNQIITVADNLPPVLIVPANITINCNASTLPANTGIATANDNCGGVLIPTSSDVTTAGSCTGKWTITRTWTVTDCSGNISTGVQTISIVDNEAPVVSAPQKTISCISLIPLAYTNLTAFLADGNTVTNNCGGPLIFAFVEEVPNYPIGVSGYCPVSIVRTYRITDDCGNATVFNQTLNINNPVPPCNTCSSCLYNNSLHEIDFTGDPVGSITVTTRKEDKCCVEKKPNGQDIDPGWCASFNVLLDPDAIGVTIKIDGGPTPPGQDWKLNCNVIDGGGIICLPGGTYNLFTFCKKGDGVPQLTNNYTFTSVIGATTGDDAYARVGDGCDVQLNVDGITSGWQWNSISPGTPGQYNGYLSATDIKDPFFTPDAFAPASIQYEVCGYVGTVLCDNSPRWDCDIITVHAKDQIVLQLNLDPSQICGNVFPVLFPIVEPTGSYTYEWFSGYDATGTSYGISNTFIPPIQGPYSVKITDTQYTLYPCSSEVFSFDVGSDATPPEITPPPTLTLECNENGNTDLIANWLSSATAIERGLPFTPVTNNYMGFTQICNGSLTVTFSATDDCGNTGTATSQIIIADISKPVWIDPLGSINVSVECSNAAALVSAQSLNPVYDDQCDDILIPVKTSGLFVPGVICPNEGSYTNTWVVTDACGNTSDVFTQVITITDNTSPVWNTVAGILNQTVECGDVSGLAAAQALVPLVSDNCGLNLIPVKTEVGFVAGSCGNTGTYTNSFSVTDACGNIVAAPYIQIITMVDNTAASIICPDEINVNALDGNCFATVIELGTPTGNDNCGGTLNFTNNATAQFPVGTTVVTWTATDACNNQNTCTQNVTVIDNEQPPTITCPAPIVLTALANDCELKAVVVPDPVTNDNCAVVLQTWTMSGATTGSSSNTGINVVNGQDFEVGVTKVDYMVADAAGNSETCSFTVTIHDNRIPEFTTCPGSITVSLDVGDCDMYIDVPDPVVWDPCDEIVSVAHNSKYGISPSDASGVYPAGVHTITWAITDETGNSNTCQQIITVIDNQVLSIDCDGLYITDFADFGEIFATGIVVGEPVVEENCHDPKLTWVLDPPVNTLVDPPVDYETMYTAGQLEGDGFFVGTGTYYVGITTVYYTLTDTLGNEVECSFTITIEAKPEIQCEPGQTFDADNNCEYPFNPGVPALLSGAQPIDWTWTLSWPGTTTDPAVNLTGGSTTTNLSPIPSPIVTSPRHEYDFHIGTTTITWTATNDAGVSTCSQTITVTDNQPPTFTAGGFEGCVESLMEVTYTGVSDILVFNIDYKDHDYYLMRIASDILDINMTSYSDNCCAPVNNSGIRWEIDFEGSAANEPTIPGTGQPSEFGSVIYLWGDGVNFVPRTHKITYWIKDCHDNESDPVTVDIIINPRPKVQKL